MGKNVLKVMDNALSLLPRVVLEVEGSFPIREKNPNHLSAVLQQAV